MEAGAFEAVVTHLLNNAIEASAPGQPVRLAIRHEKRRVLIDIVDRGPGMSPEFVRDHLFRPFLSTKRQGTGIGAFQARELLRAAGGDLLVLSEPGAGTTMRVLLPAEGIAVAEAAALSA
jgi:signal transduction histidine kinase